MLWLTLDKCSRVPMIRQVYGQIRRRILNGELPAGTRLPSSRELSERLGVSRNVILEAYDLLYAEGFTESRTGSGTYIAPGSVYPEAPPPQAPEPSHISTETEHAAGVIDFKSGTPDLRLFPARTWLSMLKRVYARPSEEVLAYGQPEGRMELREAICRHVVERRGVCCHPDQVIITSGTTQAIGIVCALLLRKQREAVLEDPITLDIQHIVRGHGGVILPVPVDGSGIITERLPQGPSPAFVFVTPSHQFPLGGTLPIQRRIDLLHYADAKGAFIVEDDYDSEFRFDGPPISSLHGLCPERVIYIGTFSKTFCPSIRTGYLVLPKELIAPARTLKWQSDLHNDTASQLALAEFITRGHYLRHISKMKKLYRQRRLATVNALTDAFGEGVCILGSETGLHLSARFQKISFTKKRLARIESQGARVYPVSHHNIVQGQHRDTLVMGYGNLDPDIIRQGIGLLKDALG
ncbi:PLP-dependent aminotransferase family protein [Desulfoluna spongiiphila]|uniref:Transcriptional regulator, GntR family n=1 Tax=Desulfoluna spongiiphila TaxID=419481 RepID=A0A1G5F9B6_9BACT|nr:PLP-dependent aminotransferase family protein [Desulfoluna spongiiphila]SCY35238.1 transcriptional regulator, GntR family [Desulfoluna spongiiphila]